MLHRIRAIASIAAGSLLLAGCMTSGEPLSAANDEVSVVSVEPASGTAEIEPGAPVVVRFSRPMMIGMDTLVMLHEGSASGPVVPMSIVWSADRTMLIGQPTVPLRPLTAHTLHLAPGMMDAEAHGLVRMNESMMGGMAVGGMMGTQRDRNGMHSGMSFTFTTR